MRAPTKLGNLKEFILAENTMKADALATALNVMGLEQGLKYSNIHKIRSVYILKENENYILKTSKWFWRGLKFKHEHSTSNI